MLQGRLVLYMDKVMAVLDEEKHKWKDINWKLFGTLIRTWKTTEEVGIDVDVEEARDQERGFLW